jgi:hypothetical protein
VIKNIFWSHASQRAEYVDFGDAITFDTTHKTNSKKMPLAMFVGANNNLKNVTFGQALIGDESVGSFKWLFETFKSCMGGREPHVILTGEPHLLFLIAKINYCKKLLHQTVLQNYVVVTFCKYYSSLYHLLADLIIDRVDNRQSCNSLLPQLQTQLLLSCN